jgi:hypothetical protein
MTDTAAAAESSSPTLTERLTRHTPIIAFGAACLGFASGVITILSYAHRAQLSLRGIKSWHR